MLVRLILRLLSLEIITAIRKVIMNSTSIGTLVYRETGLGIFIKGFTNKLLLSIVFVVLMAISANSFIYLPFTPVPMTMQVFTVLMAALLLGSRWALASQVLYISLGLAGVPVFAGFKSGLLVLTGPTAGYIIGFTLASFIAGYIFENNAKKNGRPSSILLAGFISSLAGLLIIYFLGFINLFGFLFAAGGTGIAGLLEQAFKLGVAPFIVIDFLKILIILNILNLDVIKK